METEHVFAIFSNRENPFQTEAAALTSNNPTYVQMLQNYFDILWRSGRSNQLYLIQSHSNAQKLNDLVG